MSRLAHSATVGLTAAVTAAGLAIGAAALPAAADAVPAAPSHVAATAAVAPAKHRPALRITTDRRVYHYRAVAHVTVHLGQVRGANRAVTITAHPVGRKAHVLRKGRVNKHGILRAKVRVQRNLVFAAHFRGSAKDAAVGAHVKRRVRLRLNTGYSHTYAKKGRVHLLHHTGHPRFLAGTVPQRTNRVIHFSLWYHKGKKWVKYDHIGVRTGQRGKAAVGIGEPNGYLFRIHAHYDGDHRNYAATTQWSYFRFTK